MLLGLVSHYFFGLTIFFTSLFLVLLVLVQRGRGGGIAGALGGAGGQSAFGTKAGDLFTRITVGVAVVWILLCCGAIYFLKTPEFSTGIKNRDATSLKSDSAAASSGTTTDGGVGGLGAMGASSGAAVTGSTPAETSSSGSATANSGAVPEVTTIPGATEPATKSATDPTVEPSATPAVEPATENPPAGDPPAPTTPDK